jgi:hypothetical protein
MVGEARGQFREPAGALSGCLIFGPHRKKPVLQSIMGSID